VFDSQYPTERENVYTKERIQTNEKHSRKKYPGKTKKEKNRTKNSHSSNKDRQEKAVKAFLACSILIRGTIKMRHFL